MQIYAIDCHISINIEIGMNSTVVVPETTRIETIKMGMNGMIKMISEIREKLQDIRSYVLQNENVIALECIDVLLEEIENEEVA